MKRLIEEIVFSGFTAACRRASWPTRRSPDFVNATTEGVVRDPFEFGTTVGSPASMTAMTELVVPRSIPTVLGILFSPQAAWLQPAGDRYRREAARSRSSILSSRRRMIATASKDNPRSRRRRRARRSLRTRTVSGAPGRATTTSSSTRRPTSARLSPEDLASRRITSSSAMSGSSLIRGPRETRGFVGWIIRGPRETRGFVLSLPQLLGEFAQLRAERDWQTDVNLGVEVAVAPTSESGHAEAAKPKPGPVLRLRWHPERHPCALERRHHHLASEQRDVERHLDPYREVITLATEGRVRQHVDADEEVPRTATVPPGRALAGGTDTRPVADAGWNTHLHPAGALRGMEFHRSLRAPIRLLQRDGGFRFDVLARQSIDVEGGPAASGRPRTLPIQIVKEIGEGAVRAEEIIEVVWADRVILNTPRTSKGAATRPSSRLPGPVLLPLRAELVVLLPLVRAAENLMRLVDLFELLGGTRIAWVDVRMVLAGQLPKGGLDLLLAGRARHAQYLIVVAIRPGHLLDGCASLSQYLSSPEVL